MNAVDAIKKLEWKKSELESLNHWINGLDFHRPVHGVHWQKLRGILVDFQQELDKEVEEMEHKIKEKMGDIEVDI